MSILAKIKSLLPASSRSLHAMYHELGQMHGQMGQMWAEVGHTRIMALDTLKHVEQIEGLYKRVIDMDNRHMLLLWELYRREGEGLDEAKRRFLTGLDHAHGTPRVYQLASAQLLNEFDAFCTEHGLTYWLFSGTLLGAVRHKGFIPWDDDLDVGMTRQDIERIVELTCDDDRYEVTVRYDYYVNCRQARFRFADAQVPCFIDLFYFDPVAELDKATFVAREAERAALEADLVADEAIHAQWNKANQYVDDGSDVAAPVAAYFNTHVQALYDQGILVDNIDEAAGLIWGIDNVNSGVSHHSWYMIPRDAILPIGRLPFEGLQAAVPADTDRCLTDIFGDYFDIPQTVGSYFDHLLYDALHDKDVLAALDKLAAEHGEVQKDA